MDALIITNIKISFLYEERIIITDPNVLDYHARNIWIIKFESYTCSILGRNSSHVNLTGLKSLDDINTAVQLLSEISNINTSKIPNIKIDSISSYFKTKSGLKTKLIECISPSYFRIFKPIKFCGIIIKYNKISCTYFNSGKCILVGCKTIKQAHETHLLYIKFLNEL